MPSCAWYAHRGSPGSTSYENTVPAVAASLAAGADGVEVDLRLSSDGVLVVRHDADLRRLAASPLLVPTTWWDELGVACEMRGVPLARAEWMLAAVAGRPVILELKHPIPGLVPRTTAALVELLSSLAAAGLPLDVTVSSFSPALVAAVRSRAPAALGVRTALLGRVVDRPSALLRSRLDAGHNEMHPQVAALLAEPSAVEHAHALGVTVVPWTLTAAAPCAVWPRSASMPTTDVPASARLALAARRAQAA